MKTISGKVMSGRNICEKLVDDASEELEEMTGVMFYPGSFNVKLDKPFRFRKGLLWKPWREDWQIYDERNLIPGQYRDRRVYLQRNKTSKLDEVSILAAFSFRTTYHLKDGDTIEIKIEDEHIEELSNIQYYSWRITSFLYFRVYTKHVTGILPAPIKRVIKSKFVKKVNSLIRHADSDDQSTTNHKTPH